MNNIFEARIGFGTYKLTDQEKMDAIIKAAILSGYDFIDTANYYKNEAMIGKAIKKFKKEFPDKKIPIIQTKIWPDQFKKDIEGEVRKAMKKLGNLEVIDVMLLHRPDVNMSINVKVWKALIKCQEKGLIKHIGVSNFEPDMMRILFNETGIMPEIIQDELSPSYLRKDRIKFAHDNIKMVQAWRPMGDINKTLKSPLLKSMAKKHNCSIAQLLIAFARHWNYIPVIKSENEARIADNVKKMKIKLTKKEVDEIEKNLNQHCTTVSTGTDSYAFLTLTNKFN